MKRTSIVCLTTVNQPYAGKRYGTYVREELHQDTDTFTFQAAYISILRYNPATKTTVLIVAGFFKIGVSKNEIKADLSYLSTSLQNTAIRAVQLANR